METPDPVTFYDAVWLFFIYCLAGVLVEMIYCWAIKDKGVIESRSGLLYLPFNLLYGAGGLVITLVLIPHFEDPLVVFLLGLVVGTVLEYFTSLIMEKAFHVVYWDYSDQFLNIQGRVCLKFSIFWGLLSLAVLYILHTFNINYIDIIPTSVGVPILVILVVLTIASVVLTLLNYRRIEQKIEVLKARRRGEEAEVPDSWWGRIVDRLVPDRVFINTFPRDSLSTEYQELTGHYRKLIVWRPTIGHASKERTEAKQRSQDQVAELEEQKAAAA